MMCLRARLSTLVNVDGLPSFNSIEQVKKTLIDKIRVCNQPIDFKFDFTGNFTEKDSIELIKWINQVCESKISEIKSGKYEIL